MQCMFSCWLYFSIWNVAIFQIQNQNYLLRCRGPLKAVRPVGSRLLSLSTNPALLLLGQFGRHIYSLSIMQKSLHSCHKNSGPLLETAIGPLLATHITRCECMTPKHRMVNVQNCFCSSKDIIENYIIAWTDKYWYKSDNKINVLINF